MSEAKNEDFVDVRETLDDVNDSDDDEHDEEFQDALDDLLRKSEATKEKRNEPFQGDPESDASETKSKLLENEFEKFKVSESGDAKPEKKDNGNEKEFDENQALNDEEQSDSDQEEENQEDLLEERRKREEAMTEDEIMKLKTESQTLKEEGNNLFKNSRLTEAIQSYTKALEVCPLRFPKDRSIMYSNRAACNMHLNDNTAGIEDCTKALELNPHYLKALLRRAELYEKTEKLDEALGDYQKVLEMDPRMHHAREACLRLPKQIEERNEKMKDEMIGKLKDLGNMILRPFGLSTNNFQLQQDPNSGGYSVNFQQNPAQARPPPEPTHFPPNTPGSSTDPATPPSGESDNTDSSDQRT